MHGDTPDLRLLDDVVAPRVLAAMRGASRALSALGVRHAVAGGLAVGAHGCPRNTTDVDLLVGEEAFEHHAGGLVTLKPGVPIQVDGVGVDLLAASGADAFLERSLAHPHRGAVRAGGVAAHRLEGAGAVVDSTGAVSLRFDSATARKHPRRIQ